MRRPHGYRVPHPADADDLLGWCKEVVIGIYLALPVLLVLACLCHWIDPGMWARVMEGFK